MAVQKLTGNEPAMSTDWLNPQTGNVESATGLTIRQEFAKAAMQGLIASTDWNESVATDGFITRGAELSVIYADELIKALNK